MLRLTTDDDFTTLIVSDCGRAAALGQQAL